MTDPDPVFDDLFPADDVAPVATAEAAVPPAPPSPGVHYLPDAVPTIEIAQGGLLVLDIETGPEASDVLEARFEFDAAKVPNRHLIGATFDPATVKVGNMKDQAKIDAKIAERRTAFEADVAAATIAQAQAREEQWLAFVERAPLSAVTGRVLAIGLETSAGPGVQIAGVSKQADASEAECGLLEWVWSVVEAAIAAECKVVGFNSAGFDWPFLIRRSWLHGVAVPDDLLMRGRLCSLCVDLMEVWGCGNRGERISLDRLCGFLGLGCKAGSGADFHRLYFGSPEEHQAAIDYLRHDVRLTAQAAARMGVV